MRKNIPAVVQRRKRQNTPVGTFIAPNPYTLGNAGGNPAPSSTPFTPPPQTPEQWQGTPPAPGQVPQQMPGSSQPGVPPANMPSQWPPAQNAPFPPYQQGGPNTPVPPPYQAQSPMQNSPAQGYQPQPQPPLQPQQPGLLPSSEPLSPAPGVNQGVVPNRVSTPRPVEAAQPPASPRPVETTRSPSTPAQFPAPAQSLGVSKSMPPSPVGTAPAAKPAEQQSQAPQGLAVLPARVLIEIDGQVVGEARLNKPTLTVGRQKDNDIQVPNQRVSRLHARLYADQNGWIVEDAGSVNGVTVNGERIKRVNLKKGDRINFAPEVALIYETLP